MNPIEGIKKWPQKSATRIQRTEVKPQQKEKFSYADKKCSEFSVKVKTE